jgi:hypothetical protein
MAGDINIVAIVKGDERYVFMFDDGSRAETLRTLGRFAPNPELSFSWYDAAVLSQKIRQTACTAAACEPVSRRAAGSVPAPGTFPGTTLPGNADAPASDEPT